MNNGTVTEYTFFLKSDGNSDEWKKVFKIDDIKETTFEIEYEKNDCEEDDGLEIPSFMRKEE